MKKPLYIILCLVTLVSLMAFFVQEHWHPFTFKPLAGVEVKTKFPAFTLKNFASGRLQSDLEQYSRENFGFREPLIRGYNQYLWDFYKKTNVKSVIVGKDDCVFSKNPVDDYLGTYRQQFADDLPQLRQKLRQEALRLRNVQQILAECGKHLFVVIEPSKANVYPELLPASMTSPADNVTAADIYPALFDSLGVNYIDFNRYFQEIKNTVDYALYPQLGTHWSNLAALHVTDSVLRYMAWLGHRDLPMLEISETLYDTTMYPDDDLEKLLNLSRSIRSVPNRYARFKVVQDSLSVKPSLITIGDSYYWNIAYHLPLDSLFTRHYFWYYNSTVYDNWLSKSTSELNYLQQLMATDYVVVSYSTSNLYDMSHNFSSAALVNLCHSQREVQQALDDIVRAIHNTPEWVEAIQKKPVYHDKTLEEAIRKEAAYVLYSNPDNYFPDIEEDHPKGRNLLVQKSAPGSPLALKLRQMCEDPKWMESLQKKAGERHLELETAMVMDAEWMLSQ